MVTLCSNTGTYVDSPFHRYPDGIDLSELPLDRLADLDAVVVDAPEGTTSIGADAFAGALLVGIDSLNIDDTSGGERPVHSALLAAGVPICEHLADLAPLPSDGFRFSAVPVKMKGMGTFPVPAYATIGA